MNGCRLPHATLQRKRKAPLRAATKVNCPGRPGQLTFVAVRSGAFRFRCNVACGNLHPFMIGKLVVAPNLTWLRAIAATLITAVGAMAVFWVR